MMRGGCLKRRCQTAEDEGMKHPVNPPGHPAGRMSAVARVARGLEARRALAREAALLDAVAVRMGEGSEVGEIVQALVEELGRLVPVQGVRLVLRDQDGPYREVWASGACSPGLTPLELCGDDPALLATLTEERSLVLEEAAGAPPEGDRERRPGGLLGVFDGDGLAGVLAVWPAPGHTLEPHHGLLARLSLHLSPALGNSRLYERMKALHLNTLKGLSTALNAKDYYTFGHAARVSAYVVLLLQELGWDPRLLGPCADAALLHDIGKIGISDRILLKQGTLTAEEWTLMRQHPVVSADIARPLFDEEIVRAVLHHHERFDGGGYPDGLAGGEIPTLARALCVVDSYDAMSINRPYRAARSYRECVAELVRCRGAQFDPQMVTAFLRVLGRLRRQRRWAKLVAQEAVAAIDPEKHKLLQEPADEARPEYREISAALRAVRDAHPPVRFITTQAFSGRSKVVLVVDSEEDGSADKTHLGEEFFLDEELQCVLTGREPDLLALFADEFGVWLSKSEPLRDREGRIVAAVAVDIPALDGVEMAGHMPVGPSSVVDAASARFVRAEIDSITDGLTGLYNHRYLHERLGEEVARAAKEGTELSLLFLDLDHFKQYNDRHGHRAGDRALRTVARTLERCVRRIDLVGRYGGEEFVVVLPESGTQAALETAERIRRAVEEAEGPEGAQEPQKPWGGPGLTVSIGVATFPADAAGKEELLDRADWSMYRAKDAGRNRVVVFAPEPARVDQMDSEVRPPEAGEVRLPV